MTGKQVRKASALTWGLMALMVVALLVLAAERPLAELEGRLGAQVLQFLTGIAKLRVAAAEARALDTYLVTVIDHGLNASTFAARVVAATQAGTSIRTSSRPTRTKKKWIW